jgi:hypothetical protein
MTRDEWERVARNYDDLGMPETARIIRDALDANPDAKALVIGFGLSPRDGEKTRAG